MRTDTQIIDLYWARQEAAIKETDIAYGKYLFKISYNVLLEREDSRENVNDTYFKAWNLMPPERPGILSSFLGKLCRNGAIDMYRKKHAAKRAGCLYEDCIDELSEVLRGEESAEEGIIASELSEIINGFLKKYDKDKRNVFIGRYFYMDSVKEISHYTGLSSSNVKTILSRMRKELKQELLKEGYAL
ncbi:MAG: sigma-70 family RNA polymerase sigma factor [Eubacterium sp.]|nr:sigma-70 family RNA polymerase sigma factor [Eubacterium sp.]